MAGQSDPDFYNFAVFVPIQNDGRQRELVYSIQSLNYYDGGGNTL